MEPDLDNLMDFCVRTATAAGALTKRHFGSTDVEYKGDGSEVTDADRDAEELIRDKILTTYAGHGIFGEEGADVAAAGDFRWIIDPIDGTRSFASGVPLYAVLLALEYQGRPILGCAHFPEISETVVAAEDAGCWFNGEPARVSECDDIAEARLVTSGLEYWRDWASPPGREGFDELLARVRFARTWGDAFGYAMVATGRADLLADPACGAYWDYAPMLPIVREAGGDFTTLLGGQVEAWSTALAANGALRSAATSCWAEATEDASLQTEDAIRRRSK